MKWKYKILMFLTLLIFCVGSVCATEPDNNTTDKISIDDSNGFNADDNIVNNTTDKISIDDSNGFNADVINSFTNYIIQHDPDVKELKEKVNKQELEIKELKEEVKELKEKVNKQELEIKELKERNKVLDEKRDKLSDYLMKLSNNYEKLAYDNKLLAVEKEKLNGENQVLRMQIETLNNEIKELKAKLPK